MATGYGVCVYILYGHRAISLRAIGNGPVQNRREIVQISYRNRAVIMGSSYSLSCLHRNRTNILSYGTFNFLYNAVFNKIVEAM